VNPAGFDPGLSRAVLLFASLFVAVLAAYAALDLARRVRAVPTAIGVRWLAGAAGCLAIGVWSLHVLALVDHPLPYPVGEHPFGSLAVFAVAGLTALCGLGAVSGRVMTWPRVVAGAAGLGGDRAQDEPLAKPPQLA